MLQEGGGRVIECCLSADDREYDLGCCREVSLRQYHGQFILGDGREGEELSLGAGMCRSKCIVFTLLMSSSVTLDQR